MIRGQSLVRSVVGHSKAAFSTSSARAVPTAFRFPAMSPTMTEGGIARWVVKEGDSFAPGDVLLEIETDKATMDVETTEEGIMGKIIMQDGAKEIQVGTLIAITAEEGDDISNLSASDFEGDASASSSSAPPPAAETKKADSTPTPAPSTSTPTPSSEPSSSSSSHGTSFSHAQPLSPSVNRLLLSSSLSKDEVSALKGSGMRGALTKGDVLKAMGKTSTVWGSKEAEGLEKEGLRGVSARYKLPASSGSPSAPKAAPPPPQDPVSVRRAIIAGFSAPAAPSSSATAAAPKPARLDFDSLVADYAVNQKKKAAAAPEKKAAAPAPAPKKVDSGVYEGIW